MQAQHVTEQTRMRSYEMSTPRLAVGTAAVALSAVAMAIMVIIPATMEAEASEATMRSTPAAVVADGTDRTREARLDVTCAADDGGNQQARR